MFRDFLTESCGLGPWMDIEIKPGPVCGSSRRNQRQAGVRGRIRSLNWAEVVAEERDLGLTERGRRKIKNMIYGELVKS